MKTVRIKTKNLHLPGNEVVAGVVTCTPGEPLEIDLDTSANADIELPDELHIGLARTDPHVHFRESRIPSREEYAADIYHPSEMAYEEIVETIQMHNRGYDVYRGSLAALKGGVWLVGCMGNVPYGPVGKDRWLKLSRYYQEKALVYTHVWPRMEPGVPPIEGQEEKDFGTTFGGSGLNPEDRKRMYLMREGGMVSYHNDKPRDGESLEEFKQRENPPDYMLHHLYYDGQTVLDAQRETIEFAKEAKLKSLLTRHIPTGAALATILQARAMEDFYLPAEIGLDYLYFNREMLHEREKTRDINYRRPALPSKEDQDILIELTHKCAQRRYELTFIGSDHAPHSFANKQYRTNGLPGAPGTRILEHTHQVMMHLFHEHNFSLEDINYLTAEAPAIYMSHFRDFPYPIGKMENGAMCNLVVFSSDEEYTVDENQLRQDLKDPEYHTAYLDERLRGRVYYTVVNGVVYDVVGEIKALNASQDEIHQRFDPGMDDR